MNKKFYFGLALTAGLFASCSSDDVTTSEARQIAAIDDNAPAKVELNVGSIGATVETRGTGSVGVDGTGATGYGWAGQKFNAFMLEKGTMKYAHMVYGDATSDFVFADDPTDPTAKNGKGAEFTTPDQLGTPGLAPAGLTSQLEVYYPTEGVYDFWAYRLDDAYKGAAIEGYDDATADAIKIPFEIDGTQDIMTATVTPSAAYQTAWEDKLYSAYTGRRDVKAELDFKHQLTRLTFKVKANSIEVSENATPVPGTPTYNGFMVTGISVMSNTTGKLVAAYKDTYDVSNGVLEWNAVDWSDPTTLTELELKSRAYGVLTAEDGQWYDIPTTANVGDNINFSSPAGSVTITADTKVYLTDSNHPSTNVPNGTSMTFSAWKATTPTAAAHYWRQLTAYAPDLNDVNLNDNLQTLIPVQPQWDVTTPATHAETDLYAIPATCQTAANAAAVATALATATATAGDYVFFTEDDKAYKTYTWDGSAVTATSAALYTEPAGVVAVADEAAMTAAQDAAATTGTTVYKIGTTKYVSSDVTVVAVSSGVPTPVGEAIMAAPADPNGYKVTVTYSYWKKLTATTSEEVTGAKVSKQIVLKNKTGVQTAQAYKPGKQYNITIELFKNGTAESTTTVTDWADDTENELDDSYEFE